MMAIRAHSVQQPDVVIARLDNELGGLRKGHGVISIMGVDPEFEVLPSYYHRFCRSRVTVSEFHNKNKRIQLPRSLVSRFVNCNDNLILNSWDALCLEVQRSFKESAIPESPGYMIDKRFNITNLLISIDKWNVNLTFDPDVTKIVPVYNSVKMEEMAPCSMPFSCDLIDCPCGCGMRVYPNRVQISRLNGQNRSNMQYIPSISCYSSFYQVSGSARATPLGFQDSYNEYRIRMEEEVRRSRDEALSQIRQSFYVSTDMVSGR